MDLFGTAKEELEGGRQRSSSVLVSFSGGKDSLCTLDLCSRFFEHVEAFFMYFVPGLECVDFELEKARRRWGVKIHEFPHWSGSIAVGEGIYTFPPLMSVPKWGLGDVFALAQSASGIKLIASGARSGDSPWRRRNMATTSYYDDVIFPLRKWGKFEVLSYLKARSIPLPPSSGKAATGIDLSTPSLLWLHDTFPRDFARICEVFPFAEAVVWRRKWYGVEA